MYVYTVYVHCTHKVLRNDEMCDILIYNVHVQIYTLYWKPVPPPGLNPAMSIHEPLTVYCISNPTG